jgi:predicted HAD superfamily Cof-like phosphohydrolase
MTDLYKDVVEFTKLYIEKTKKQPPSKIDVKFIRRMIIDEMEEFEEAKDLAEQIDALLDAVYYILNACAKVNYDVSKSWGEIMTSLGISTSNDMIKDAIDHFNLDKDRYKKWFDTDKKMLSTSVVWYICGTAYEITIFDEEDKVVTELLEIVHFMLCMCATTNIDVHKIWDLIHKANMTKFTDGYEREDGKWCKPANFVPPDAAIREEICRQLNQN